MGILDKVTPQPVRDKVRTGIEAIVPEKHREHVPDALTFGGVALTATGVAVTARYPRIGAWLRSGAQLLDDVDGTAANLWGRKDEAGKKKDATADKLKFAMEFFAHIRAASMLPPGERLARRVVFGTMAAKHAVNASLNLATLHYGGNTDTHTSGRINTWMDGLSAGFLVSADATDRIAHPKLHTAENAIGYTAAAVGAVTGVVSASVYASRLVHAYRHRNDGLGEIDLTPSPEPPDEPFTLYSVKDVVDSEDVPRDPAA